MHEMASTPKEQEKNNVPICSHWDPVSQFLFNFDGEAIESTFPVMTLVELVETHTWNF